MGLKQKLSEKKFIFSTLLSAFLSSIPLAQAQETTQINGLLNYPLSNSFVLHGFGNNPSEMDKLNRFMNLILGDSTIQVSDIHITGYSSPDGPYTNNEQLAYERVINLKEYIDKTFNLSSRGALTMHFVAEDWDGLQRQLSAADYPQRDEVARIINNIADPDKRERKIKRLSRGSVYRDLCNNYFPILRRVEINVECVQDESASILNTQQNISLYQPMQQDDLIRMQRQKRMYQNNKRRIHREQLHSQDARYSYSPFRQPSDFFPQIAIKTNLLAFAGVNSDLSYTSFIPNLSVELYFKKHWSAEFSIAYSNWAYRNGRRFQGISAYTFESRYWLQSNGQFKGIFAGAYVQLGDYNLQKHHNVLSVEGNRTGRYHSEGLSLGYLQPIYNRLSAEVSVRVGYRHSEVKEYRRDADLNQYKYSHNQDEFDITGSRLNIVYRF